jgi:hypothetical protein
MTFMGGVVVERVDMPEHILADSQASPFTGCHLTQRYRNYAKYVTVGDSNNPVQTGKAGQGILHRAVAGHTIPSFGEMIDEEIQLNNGIIPKRPTTSIDHLCRNRACHFEGHLEPVTEVENTLRALNAAPRLNLLNRAIRMSEPDSTYMQMLSQMFGPDFVDPESGLTVLTNEKLWYIAKTKAGRLSLKSVIDPLMSIVPPPAPKPAKEQERLARLCLVGNGQELLF